MHQTLLRKTAGQGFTLLEALVVMAVLGVLVSLAAPGLSTLRQQHQLQAEAEGLFNSLVLARSEALRRQQRVNVCARGSNTECDAQGRWQQGWLVFVDANDNLRHDADEALLEVHAALSPSIQVAVSNTAPAYFSYSAEGRSMTPSGAFMAGTWSFCSPSRPLTWQVLSNALGKPRLQKLNAQVCG